MGKPKYILGGATRGGFGGFAVQFTFAIDEGYDRLIDVEDISMTSVAETATLTHNKNSITLTHTNVDDVYQKRYRMYFESGDVEEINVIIPPSRRGFTEGTEGILRGPVIIHGGEYAFLSRYEVLFPVRKDIPTSQVAVIPHSDPGNRFSFDGVWKSGGGSTYSVHDTTDIIRAWNSFGYEGGAPSLDTKEIQHATFLHILDDVKQYNSKEELYSDFLEPTGANVFLYFVWAKDINPLAEGTNIKSFRTCIDPSSPSYFRTTGLESNGDAIPQDYLDNRYPAYWSDGACAVDCSPFETYARVALNDGSQKTITAGVAGNEASPLETARTSFLAKTQYNYPSYPPLNASFFSYELIVPQGVTYEGVTSFPNVNDTSKTWNDLPYSKLPYLVRITDDATGCTDEIAFRFDSPLTEGQDCVCHVPGSLNYVAHTGLPTDECGICLNCKSGYLEKDDVQTGENLVLNTNSTIIEPSSVGLSDGQIIFNGLLNILSGYPQMESFLSGTYDIYLYAVAGPNDPVSSPPIVTALAESNPNYTFPGLPEGHYVVQIFSTGELCVSAYRFELTDPEGTNLVPCVPAIKYYTNPCGGQSNIQIDAAQPVHEIIYTLNGNVVPSPPVVGAGNVIGIYVDFASPECIDFYWEHEVLESELVCNQKLPPEEVYGCTDPAAFNYNAEPGVIEDGSCFYGVPGCTDPSAANYEPTATLDNGTCIHGVVGCTNPLSPNFEPLANIDNGLCLPACDATYILTVILNGSLVPSIIFVGAAPASYDLTYTNTTTGNVVTVLYGETAPSLGNGIWNVSLVTAEGCEDSFWFTVGTNYTLVFGCMDEHASNYELAANVSADYYDPIRYPTSTYLGPCVYTIEHSVCIPTEMNSVDRGVNGCLSTKTTEFLTNLRSGRVTSCNDHDVRLLHLLQYLISRRGLECIYNCKDSMTPEPGTSSSSEMTCEEQWIYQGSNDWNIANAYSNGDVVTYKKNPGVYYTSIWTGAPALGIGSQPPSGLPYWVPCVDPISTTETIGDPAGINRLDTYFAWIQKTCKDCGLPAVPGTEGETIIEEPTETGTIIDGSRIDFGGDEPTF